MRHNLAILSAISWNLQSPVNTTQPCNPFWNPWISPLNIYYFLLWWEGEGSFWFLELERERVDTIIPFSTSNILEQIITEMLKPTCEVLSYLVLHSNEYIFQLYRIGSRWRFYIFFVKGHSFYLILFRFCMAVNTVEIISNLRCLLYLLFYKHEVQ